MPETQIVLIVLLAMGLVTLLGVFTVAMLAHAKNRIIREQQRILAAEQRLRHSQEAFMDNAHHELRTPLQILTGHLQMLGELDLGPDQQAVLGAAQGAAQRLGHLVQQLLDLSSLHQGTLAIQSTATLLSPSLAGLAACFRAGAEAKGLRLQVELPTLPRPLVCDAPRLCQALEALLDNALAFSDRGVIGFRLDARQTGSRWQLRFEVQDEGPGLPAPFEHLLRPFEQAETGFRRHHGGLGVGLPLAHGIVRLLGGQMGFMPVPRGTLVWLEVAFEEAVTD